MYEIKINDNFCEWCFEINGLNDYSIKEIVDILTRETHTTVSKQYQTKKFAEVQQERIKMTSNPETKYLVVSVRKSDNQTFFPENPNHRKGIEDFDTALNIAKSKAQKNSDAYEYVVYRCVPMVAVELDNLPTKLTYYNNIEN